MIRSFTPARHKYASPIGSSLKTNLCYTISRSRIHTCICTEQQHRKNGIMALLKMHSAPAKKTQQKKRRVIQLNLNSKKLNWKTCAYIWTMRG